MKADFEELLSVKLRREHKQHQLRIGTLRELVMAHQAHQRAVNEFSIALGIDLNGLNDTQAAAIFRLCGETDPREVSDETLINLMKQLEDLG
jgi:hypothetical protein